LGVVWLPDQAAAGSPEFMQLENDGLEIKRHGGQKLSYKNGEIIPVFLYPLVE
jgi:hypothetical protein